MDEDKRFTVDFTQFQGETIEDDLQKRDFTVTSMAIDIHQDDVIIDPFQGSRDLKDRILRATTSHALKDDPLRCIRAVRLAAQFNLKMLPETREQIKKNQQSITDISTERVRDELFRLLSGPKQTTALMTLNQLGTYPIIFSDEFKVPQQNLLRWLERLWSILMADHSQDKTSNWALGLFAHRLGRYRGEIRDHLDFAPVPGRTVYQLSFLAPLIYPIWISESLENNTPHISFSNQEIKRLVNASLAARNFIDSAERREDISPLLVYRYFQSYGSEGVEGVFLGLADFLGNQKSSLTDLWPDVLDTARSFLEGWWEKRDQWVNPPALLNGHDLQREFKISPGPRVGELLEVLREAQVSIKISSREDALDYLNQFLDADQERKDV
jgi:hypothetical protein